MHYLDESRHNQEKFDSSLEDLADEYRRLHDMPRKRDRDGAYLANRRQMQQRFHEALKKRDDAQGKLEDDLAQAVLEVLRGNMNRVVEAVVPAEFTNQGLDRLRAKEEAEAQRAREAAAAASVQGVHGSAHDSYLAYFLAGTGRDPSEGAMGTWSKDPPPTPEQKSWDDRQWAMFFLRLGGYEESKSGAEETDGQG